MSDLPRVYTGEPLVPLSDDEIAYRANRGKWTLTEALFHLSGHKPPGYESARHLQDHFWPAYHQAVDAIQMGKICRRIEEAGERVFIDSPTNWLTWVDSLVPKVIKVDDRVRRALGKIPNKGGRRPATDSQSSDVYQQFDLFADNDSLTFRRGELTAVSNQIAENTGYKMDTVRKMIGPKYRDLQAKAKENDC